MGIEEEKQVRLRAQELVVIQRFSFGLVLVTSGGVNPSLPFPPLLLVLPPSDVVEAHGRRCRRSSSEKWQSSQMRGTSVGGGV